MPALAFTFLLLLVAPTAYSATTWLAPAEGTFPAAGPHHDPGAGAYGVNARDEGIDRALADYVSTHDPGTRWALLTVASDTASPMMLFGLDAGALGGYSGTDPAVDGPGLARLVANREARYVLLGGEYSLRGGNLATRAVLQRLHGAGAVGLAQPGPLPVRPRAVRLRRARTGTRGRGLSAQAATERSWWKARANSSVSRLAAQRGTAASPSAITRSSTCPSPPSGLPFSSETSTPRTS